MAEIDDANTHSSQLYVCAVQPTLRRDDESPLDALYRILESLKRIQQTTKERIDLFVLPELSPIGYSEDTFDRFLPNTSINKDLQRQIDQAFADLARSSSVYISYGCIGCIQTTTTTSSSVPKNTREESFTIRQKVVNPLGIEIAVYDKTYLCDYGYVRIYFVTNIIMRILL